MLDTNTLDSAPEAACNLLYVVSPSVFVEEIAKLRLTHEPISTEDKGTASVNPCLGCAMHRASKRYAQAN